MALFRPTYRDPKTGATVQSKIWWFDFYFAGKRIRESAKTTRKTVAAEAEKKRHQEYELRYNAVESKKVDRVKSVGELADAFLTDYTLRNPRSATFATFAVGHLKRLCGRKMSIDVSSDAVREYQNERLIEKASPKTINEEVGFLLRILGDQGDVLRVKLRRERALKLKVRNRVAKAWTSEEKAKLLEAARSRRSPSIYPALNLALNCGMRDTEIRELVWGRVNLEKGIVTVGQSKTDAGQGRTIPLNADAFGAMVAHAKWFLEKFGETRADWYVFPFGKPQPTDPTRPVTTLKTVWNKIKSDAGVKGRWHDNRHTFITDLAESGAASDETIKDLAGHVSNQMLKHYSHIRMEAKRRAVDALVARPSEPAKVAAQDIADAGKETLVKEITKVSRVH